MKPGVLTRTPLLRPPASIRQTESEGSSLSRPATAQPADPPPMTMISYSLMLSPMGLFIGPYRASYSAGVSVPSVNSGALVARCCRADQAALMLSLVSRLLSWLQPGGRSR